MQEIQGLLENLEQMEKVDIKEISISNLPNIKDFEVDTSKNISNRFIEYLQFVKNPYVFRVDGFGVKIEFAGDTPFKEALIRCFNDHIQ